jgi:RNA polymerase sigma-70 factor (ECF subfamily)
MHMTQPVTQDNRCAVIWEENVEDEGDLLRAARDNPAAMTQAFAQLYDRYVKILYKYLLGKTGNVAEAEDLTSQTFLSALENLSGYREQGNFRAWLFCLAHNKWVDFYRKRKRLLFARDNSAGGSEVDFLAEVIQGEKSQVLAVLVRKLDSSEIELIRLRLVTGLGFREIAEIQGKSESAVKKAYYRLIERMKKDMEQIYG